MTKKDPHKEALDRRRKEMANIAAESVSGRKASVPLHVMLEPEQMERYRKLQKDLDLPMREVVVLAMDALVGQVAKVHQKQIDDVRRVHDMLEGVTQSMTAMAEGRFNEALAQQNFIADASVDSLRDFALSLAVRVSRLESTVSALSDAGVAP